MDHKKAMLAKVNIGRGQLPEYGDEDTWRDMLENIGGNRRSSQMSEAQLARVIHFMAERGAVFTSRKQAGAAGKNAAYKAKAAQRRSDFYEIPDGPYAPQMRKIAALWQELGYAMTSLDARVKRQFGVDAFRWLRDPAKLQTLGRDLEKRLARKKATAAA
jgi:hypothetical protein